MSNSKLHWWYRSESKKSEKNFLTTVVSMCLPIAREIPVFLHMALLTC